MQEAGGFIGQEKKDVDAETVDDYISLQLR